MVQSSHVGAWLSGKDTSYEVLLRIFILCPHALVILHLFAAPCLRAGDVQRFIPDQVLNRCSSPRECSML